MTHRHLRNNTGFTLIEILIAMAISGVVLGGIYQVYTNQMRVNNTQNQVVDMQQNVRVAMYFMERDIRLAGFNPTGGASVTTIGPNNTSVGINTASANTITLSMDQAGGEGDNEDNDRDGETDETPECDGSGDDEIITYSLSNDVNPVDGQNDALFDGSNTACNLLRNGQRLASNIDALNFVYLGVDDTDPTCGEACLLGTPTTPQELADIRAVQITIIARSGANIPGLSVPFTDENEYHNQPPLGDIVLPRLNDGFRRVRLTTEVRVRNNGLL